MAKYLATKVVCFWEMTKCDVISGSLSLVLLVHNRRKKSQMRNESPKGRVCLFTNNSPYFMNRGNLKCMSIICGNMYTQI